MMLANWKTSSHKAIGYFKLQAWLVKLTKRFHEFFQYFFQDGIVVDRFFKHTDTMHYRTELLWNELKCQSQRLSSTEPKAYTLLAGGFRQIYEGMPNSTFLNLMDIVNVIVFLNF